MGPDALRQRRLEVIREHMDTEVMEYYRPTRTAFPDQRHDTVRYRVAAEFYGLPPTGRAFRVPVAAVFFFDGNRIVNKRIYFDSASRVSQIGRTELLTGGVS